MKTEIYYKAVRVIDDEFYSVYHLGRLIRAVKLIRAINSPFFLKYEIGKKTIPEYGNIFTFFSIQSAYRLKAHDTDPETIKILEGEGELAESENIIYKLPDSYETDIIIKFWKESYSCFNLGLQLPKGTRQLKWFKPLAVVTSKNITYF
jgi:hypothetical protein